MLISGRMQESLIRDLIRWAKELARDGGSKWDALVRAARLFQSGDFAWPGRSPEDVAQAWLANNIEGCRSWLAAPST